MIINSVVALNNFRRFNTCSNLDWQIGKRHSRVPFPLHHFPSQCTSFLPTAPLSFHCTSFLPTAPLSFPLHLFPSHCTCTLHTPPVPFTLHLYPSHSTCSLHTAPVPFTLNLFPSHCTSFLHTAPLSFTIHLYPSHCNSFLHTAPLHFTLSQLEIHNKYTILSYNIIIIIYIYYNIIIIFAEARFRYIFIIIIIIILQMHVFVNNSRTDPLWCSFLWQTRILNATFFSPVFEAFQLITVTGMAFHRKMLVLGSLKSACPSVCSIRRTI